MCLHVHMCIGTNRWTPVPSTPCGVFHFITGNELICSRSYYCEERHYYVRLVRLNCKDAAAKYALRRLIQTHF